MNEKTGYETYAKQDIKEKFGLEDSEIISLLALRDDLNFYMSEAELSELLANRQNYTNKRNSGNGLGLFEEYAEYRNMKYALKEKLKEIEEKLGNLEKEMIDYFEENKITSQTVPGGKIYMSEEFYYKQDKDGIKEKVIEEIKTGKHELFDVISINSRTFNSLMKERASLEGLDEEGMKEKYNDIIESAETRYKIGFRKQK